MTEEEKKAQEAAAAEAAQNAEQTASGDNGGEAAAEGNTSEGAEQEAAPAEKSPRDIFYERIRTNVPDGKYDDDEMEVYRQAGSLLDKAEEGSKKYDQMIEKLMRRYQDDPEEVSAIMDYIEGTPLIEAIIKNKGEEALTMKEGDEGWEGYQAAVAKRKEDRQKAIDTMEEIQRNAEETVNEFNAWADEHGFNKEQRIAIWDVMNSDLDMMGKGKFTRDIFDRYNNAIHHDEDVEGAHEQGKAEGKNEAIDVKKTKMKGSGLPAVDAGGAAKEEKKPLDPREQFAQRMAGWRRG